MRANSSGSSGNAWKECTRIIVGVIGVIFVVSSTSLTFQTLIILAGPGYFPNVARNRGQLQPRVEPFGSAQKGGIHLHNNRCGSILDRHPRMDRRCNKEWVSLLWRKWSLLWLTIMFTKFGYLAMTCFLICTSLGVSIFVEKGLLLQQLNEGCELKSGVIYEMD